MDDAGQIHTRREVPAKSLKTPTTVSPELQRSISTSRLPRIRSASEVYRDFGALARLDREAFVVLLMDQKNRVTGVHVASVGSLSRIASVEFPPTPAKITCPEGIGMPRAANASSSPCLM